MLMPRTSNREDALRHAELFQCASCWSTFGKPYSLTRHQDKTPQACARGEKRPDAVLLNPIDLERLRRIQEARTYEQLKEAISDDWIPRE